MSTSLLLERSSVAAAPVGGTYPAFHPGIAATGAQAAANWCVLPRCRVEFDKCKGGLKIQCCCEEEVACGTLQNLCRMLADGLCSCCVTCNGLTVFQCNLTMGICKCEYTKDGVAITCTSGDKSCCEMLQACCDCLECCCKSGCCCYISFNNTPVCCGTC